MRGAAPSAGGAVGRTRERRDHRADPRAGKARVGSAGLDMTRPLIVARLAAVSPTARGVDGTERPGWRVGANRSRASSPRTSRRRDAPGWRPAAVAIPPSQDRLPAAAPAAGRGIEPGRGGRSICALDVLLVLARVGELLGVFEGSGELVAGGGGFARARRARSRPSFSASSGRAWTRCSSWRISESPASRSCARSRVAGCAGRPWRRR